MSYIDTTIGIFDVYFWIRVPIIQVTSELYSRVYGRYITGDKTIDNKNMNEYQTVQATINTMIEHYKKGVMIKVVYDKDTKIIYEYIKNHIEAWISHLNSTLNVGDAPIDDLLEMDRFAKDIYEHAKYLITRATVPIIFNNNNVFCLTKNNLFKTDISIPTLGFSHNNEYIDPKDREYDSNRELLKMKLNVSGSFL